MVRFSDMLGGDGQPDDARAATEARDLPPLADDVAPDVDAPVDESSSPATEVEAEPVAADPSPQDVLDRLTQYATATRAAAPPPEPQPEPEQQPPAPPTPAATTTAPTEPTPTPAAATTPAPETQPPPRPTSPTANEDTGDDILPRAKRSLRNPRGKRRDS